MQFLIDADVIPGWKLMYIVEIDVQCGIMVTVVSAKMEI